MTLFCILSTNTTTIDLRYRIIRSYITLFDGTFNESGHKQNYFTADSYHDFYHDPISSLTYLKFFLIFACVPH